MRSLLQMVHDLQREVGAIKAEVAQLKKPVIVAPTPPAEVKQELVKQEQPTRAMCPKCGVKPNYFFHVKTCSGSQKEQKNADQNTVRRRDQGTP